MLNSRTGIKNVKKKTCSIDTMIIGKPTTPSPTAYALASLTNLKKVIANVSGIMGNVANMKKENAHSVT